MVFTASRRAGGRVLWYQPLDSLEAKPLPGTESAVLPFWSPDSRSVAFYSEVDKKLKKVDLSGGSAVTLCAARNGSASGAWLANGSLIFYDDSQADACSGHGRRAETTVRPRCAGPKNGPAMAQSPSGRQTHSVSRSWPGERERRYLRGRLGIRANRAWFIPVRSLFEYSPDGYILYSRQQAIMAQRFDARSLTIQGDPLPVVDRAGEFSSTWGAIASASANGTLAYSRPVNRAAQLHWYSRDGKKLGSIAGARNYSQLLLSPDGTARRG